MPRRTITRSCCRCGMDFSTDRAGRVCPDCLAMAREGSGKEQAALGQALSFREQQVVRLVVEGKLNKEIAWGLHLADGTVKEYLFRIFRKTGVTNRTQLAVWALRQLAEEPVAS